MNQSMQTMYKVTGSKDEREDNNLVTVKSIQDLNKEGAVQTKPGVSQN